MADSPLLRTALLVTVPPRVTSSYRHLAFEELGGCTVLRQLLTRLAGGLAASPFDSYVVVAPEDVERAMQDSGSTRFRVVSHSGGSLTDALLSLSASHPRYSAIALYPGFACFPDVVAAKDMVAEHHRLGADLTVSHRCPAGLLPIVVGTKSLERIARFRLRPTASNDLLAMYEHANTWSPGTETIPFCIHRYSPYARFGILPASLPNNLLIDNRHSRIAAERVLKKCETGVEFGPEHAQSMKCELLDMLGRRGRRVRERRVNGPMNVLFVSYVSGFSGAEASWAALISNLDRERFRPVVVLPCRSALSDILCGAKVETAILDWNFTQLSPFNIEYFEHFIEERHIGLVDDNGSGGAAVVMAARNARVPVITHVRQFDGTSAQPLLQFSERVVTVSEAVREDVCRATICPDRVITVYNGVEPTTGTVGIGRCHARQQLHIRADAGVIAFVARIDPEKGFELFFQSLSMVRRVRPDVIALCAGEPAPTMLAYADELRGLVEHLDLADVVRWLGFTPDLEAVYAAADVLVCCNAEEPLARCMIEACAMGVPIIGPASGGALEIVEPGHNGLLFTPADPAALAEAILTVVDDGPTRLAFSAGAQRTSRKFSVLSHVNRMMDLFAEATGEVAI